MTNDARPQKKDVRHLSWDNENIKPHFKWFRKWGVLGTIASPLFALEMKML